MIHAISGKPRGGKSLYAVRLVVDELLYGNRQIITNLPLKKGELNAYFQERYPDRVVDVLNRVVILTDAETAEFWLHRGYPVEGLRRLTEAEWVQKKRPNYAGVKDNGVFYVIDEVHNFFNARAWAETGRDVLFYLSQHAKLGDTVIWVTQSIGNVDKQFRSVTQDYTYLRNMAKEKLGRFTLPNVFVRQTFTEPAGLNSQAMETGTFRLDVTGLCRLYDTAQGVGIHGRTADTAEKRKGIPWWVAVILFPAVIWAFLWYSPQVIANLTKPKVTEKQRQQLISTNVPAGLKTPAEIEAMPTQSKEQTSTSGNEAANEVVCTGWSILNGKATAFLSDGTILRERDIERLTESAIYSKGKEYRLAVVLSQPQRQDVAMGQPEIVEGPKQTELPQPPQATSGHSSTRRNILVMPDGQRFVLPHN